MQGATTLLQDTSPLTDEQRELLALLDAGSAHVVLIVEDILLHGALASGNFPVVREPLTLISAVIEPAVTTLSLQPSLQDKLADLKLVRNVDPEVPAMIMGDASRLLQVCINLLSNAVKFTPAGGRVQLLVDCMPAPELSSDAAVTAAEDDLAPRPRNWLRIRVVDSGIGVKPEKLAKIFLPFTQAEQSTVRQYGGTGLGLTSASRSQSVSFPGSALRLTRARFVLCLPARSLPAYCARDGRPPERTLGWGRHGHDDGVCNPAAAG